MIIGNNNYNPEANNFKNKMNAIKNNANTIGQHSNEIHMNQYKDVNNSEEMLSQSLEMLQERFNKGLISYDDFVKCKSYAVAKEKGLTRLEGKDYVVQDGDIMHFRFAV